MSSKSVHFCKLLRKRHRLRMLGVAVFAVTVCSTLASASYGASRCFDCNYLPSGRYGYNPLSQAGLPQCALRKTTDANFIDQWGCSSGKCFIRLDANGFVYRGCANKENLNFGVDSSIQCAYQAGSLIYFCDGDLCNKGQIGELCGVTPTPTPAPVPTTPGPVPTKPTPVPPKYKNPCDGKCYGNPSGLFPDPTNPNGFIQCGCDNHYGRTCTCCRPFHLSCPPGTTFNAQIKGCSRGKPVHKV